jgi:hypothetical protein
MQVYHSFQYEPSLEMVALNAWVRTLAILQSHAVTRLSHLHDACPNPPLAILEPTLLSPRTHAAKDNICTYTSSLVLYKHMKTFNFNTTPNTLMGKWMITSDRGTVKKNIKRSLKATP